MRKENWKRIAALLLILWMLPTAVLGEGEGLTGEDAEETAWAETDPEETEEAEESGETEEAEDPEETEEAEESEETEEAEESEETEETEDPEAEETAEEGEPEEEDPDATESSGEETVIADPAQGIWKYENGDLKVEIQRFQEEVTYKKKKYIREYFVADIHASPEAPMTVIQTEPTKKRPAGYNLVSPELLMEAHPAVFTMSDDMYGLRLKQYDYYGIIIRNGEILANKTRDSSSAQYRRAWPNLDTMAVYEDGSMKTYACDAMTPEEYLEQGAVHVFAFGPALVTEGEIGPNVMNAMDAGYNEPRVALGMVEPWHYIAVVVRGRPTTTHAGVHLDWLAEKMKELGCVEALNLDGGLTATMAFRGKILETGGEKLRSQGSMITFGQGLGLTAQATSVSGEPAAPTARTAQGKVNVRKTPEKNGRKVAQIAKKGEEVTILEETTGKDGELWYRIRTAKGKEGYVRGDLVKLDP